MQFAKLFYMIKRVIDLSVICENRHKGTGKDLSDQV